MCESGLEKKVAHFLLTHPQVADLREQPDAVQWLDAEGTLRRHTFDFLVTLKDGRKLAVAVKPKARRRRLDQILAAIANQVPTGFADGVLVMTDEDVPRDVVHNAALLHHCRRGANPTHDAIVQRLVATPGRGTVGQLVAASELGGAGFRAVVRLIANGTIQVQGGARIGYDTPVAWAGTTNGEAA